MKSTGKSTSTVTRSSVALAHSPALVPGEPAKPISPLPPEVLEQIAARFKILGDSTRLKILQSICKQSRSVNEIVAVTGSTQANVSKHLALMTAAGLLQRQRLGQSVFYGVKDQLAVKMCELVRAQLFGNG